MLAGVKLGKSKTPDDPVRKPLFAATTTSPISREGWMLPKVKSSSDLLKEAQQEELKRAELKKKEAEEKEKEASRLELEAKGGLIYMDPKKKSTSQDSAKIRDEEILVGDGGTRWRKKALLRAAERATSQGLSVQEAIAETHGSIGELQEADEALRKAQSRSQREKRNSRNRRRSLSREKGRPSKKNRKRSRSRDQESNSEKQNKKDKDERWRRKSSPAGYRRRSSPAKRKSSHKSDEERSPPSKRKPGRKSDGDKPSISRRKSWRDRIEQTDSSGVPSEDSDKNSSLPNNRQIAALTFTELAKKIVDASEKSNNDNDETLQEEETQIKSTALDTTQSISSDLTNFLYNRKREPPKVVKPSSNTLPSEIKKTSTTSDSLSESKKQNIDVNQLAAKALKAKMLGNMTLYTKLNKEIEEYHASSKLKEEEKVTTSKTEREEEIVVLSELDSRGVPIEAPSAKFRIKDNDDDDDNIQPSRGGKKKKGKKNKVENKIKDGNRTSYFDNDENVDLKTLVEQERLRGVTNYDDILADNIMNDSSYKHLSLDDQYDQADYTMDRYQTKDEKLKDKSKKETRQRNRMIAEHNRYEKQLDRCWFCFKNKNAPKHLIISLGVKMFLSLPSLQRVTDGHCLIVPIDHTWAVTEFDENVQEELQYFKKHLIKMFAAEKPPRGCVFMETVTEVRKRKHTCVECIPLPMDQFNDAPLYFKKGILESDEEWAQNKKLIDTRQKGLARSVPKGFAYFSVEFNLDGGFAHVIEDERIFPKNFGKEIICGMLEEPAQIILHATRLPLVEEQNLVSKFLSKWKYFDWTQRLEGGSAHGKTQKESNPGKKQEIGCAPKPA